MKSYGELLRETREGKELDISTVSRETAIDSALVTAMENEDDSAFPGQSYMTGFLHNYAEYLGLNPDDVLRLYHSKALQATPVPTALLVKERPRFVIPLIVTLCVLALAGGGVGVWYYLKTRPQKDPTEALVEKGNKTRQFTLGSEPLQERLYKGDQLLYPTENGQVVLTVSSTLTSLGLDTPAGTIRTDLADESEIDIDGDGKNDIIVYVSEISMTDEARGCETRVLLKGEGLEEDIAAADAGKVETLDLSSSGAHKPYVILEDNRAYSFTIDASFRGPCEFRHRIDRRKTEESYYSNGDKVTMTAFNGIRLWMSNANAVKFSITADARNYDIEIGRAGQVLVEDVKWTKDARGRYRLVVLELD